MVDRHIIHVVILLTDVAYQVVQMQLAAGHADQFGGFDSLGRAEASDSASIRVVHERLQVEINVTAEKPVFDVGRRCLGVHTQEAHCFAESAAFQRCQLVIKYHEIPDVAMTAEIANDQVGVFLAKMLVQVVEFAPLVGNRNVSHHHDHVQRLFGCLATNLTSCKAFSHSYNSWLPMVSKSNCCAANIGNDFSPLGTVASESPLPSCASPVSTTNKSWPCTRASCRKLAVKEMKSPQLAWLTGFGTNDENVGQSGDESVLQRVFHVNQVETTFVLFSVGDDTNTSQVTTTSDHDQLTGVELDEVSDLSGSQVDLDGVISSDQRVWVSDGSTVVSDNVWNTSLAQLDPLDLTQLVGSFFSGDSVHSESTFDVVDQSEVLVGSFQGDNVHETSWEGGVSSDLSVDLDVLLHQNSLDFSTVQSIF